jgi:hypothetical protein
MRLWSGRGEDGRWTQRLYGNEVKGLTPPHGVVAVLVRTAIRENGRANGPPRQRPELPGPDGQIRPQWCAGAPGIVIAAADYLEEDLLLAPFRPRPVTGTSRVGTGQVLGMTTPFAGSDIHSKSHAW